MSLRGACRLAGAADPPSLAGWAAAAAKLPHEESLQRKRVVLRALGGGLLGGQGGLAARCVCRDEWAPSCHCVVHSQHSVQSV